MKYILQQWRLRQPLLLTAQTSAPMLPALSFRRSMTLNMRIYPTRLSTGTKSDGCVGLVNLTRAQAIGVPSLHAWSQVIGIQLFKALLSMLETLLNGL